MPQKSNNPHNLTPKDAINSFGFLLQRNQPLSGSEFSARIVERYSLDEPRTKAVCDYLETLNATSFQKTLWGYEISYQ